MTQTTTESTALVSFSPEQLALEALAISQQIGSVGGDKISVKDGVFTLPDGRQSDTMDAVIVDFLFINEMYEGRYDPKKKAGPVCAALSITADGMVPRMDSPKLQVAAGTSCDACPMNQYGSAGTGKACKNTVALAITAPNASGDSEMYILKLAPTALTPFRKYVKGIAASMQLPPYGVVTHFELDPAQSYPKILCSNPTKERNPNLAETAARRQDAAIRLSQLINFGS